METSLALPFGTQTVGLCSEASQRFTLAAAANLEPMEVGLTGAASNPPSCQARSPRVRCAQLLLVNLRRHAGGGRKR